MREQTILLTCDICGDESLARFTVSFVVEGIRWTIDLCQAHGDAYHSALDRFRMKARQEPTHRRSMCTRTTMW